MTEAMSVADAIAKGDDAARLRAQIARVAEAIDDDRTGATALAALTKRLEELMAQLKALELAAKEEREAKRAKGGARGRQGGKKSAEGGGFDPSTA